MALKDEVHTVFRNNPRRTLNLFQVAVTVYSDRIRASGSLRGVSFPDLKKVHACIHEIQASNKHLSRRRIKTTLRLVETRSA